MPSCNRPTHRVLSLVCWAAAAGLAGCGSTPMASNPAPAPAPAAASPVAVVAAGSAAAPASLTAVTQGQTVVLNTVQGLHPAAEPRFKSIQLSAPAEAPADSLLGWNRGTGQVVATPAVNPSVLKLRYVRSAADMRLTPQDQVVVVATSGRLALPDLARGGIEEGKVVVIKAMGAMTNLVVSGLEGTLQVQVPVGKSLTVVAATRLDPPQWLAIE